ncbi:methyltransferase-like protein 27 [Haliotis cracherodii]|uniref:methyltransferase-like protein 27 n=1 Tax=Haliotis cracherodii TaxID=6455 RepID=UPI0039E99965
MSESSKLNASMTQEEREEAKAMTDYLIGDEETSREDIIGRFSQNSQQYEKAMKGINFKCPMQTAQTAAELFPGERKDVYVLDVAAGTGLCADELYHHGFRTMDALDPSSKMLEEAKKKGLYGRYFIEVLGENAIDIENDTYDAVTISGLSLMVLKKMPLKAMEELIRIVKPGGYIINTAFYNLFPDDGDVKAVIFRENMKTLESQGKWKQVELRRFPEVILGNEVAVSIHKVLV